MPTPSWTALALFALTVLAFFIGYYLGQLAEKKASAEERKHFSETQALLIQNTDLTVRLEFERAGRDADAKSATELSKWKAKAIEDAAIRKQRDADYEILTDVRVDAAVNRAKLEAEQAFKKRFSIDRRPPLLSRDGIVFKTYYMVLDERILFDGIPITPWITTHRQVDKQLDGAELETLAATTTAIAKAFLEGPAELPGVIKIVVGLLTHGKEASANKSSGPPIISVNQPSITIEASNSVPPPNDSDTAKPSSS
jgi:hypothetical protein